MPHGPDNSFDVVIVGAGPAGISAALWASESGLSAVVLEREHRAGGQLSTVYNSISNYAGVSFSNGEECRDAFVQSLANRRAVRVELDAEVTGIDAETRQVTLIDGRVFHGRALVYAGGVRRRVLGIEGEDKFIDKGILRSGAKDPTAARGKLVAIVGGGDAALENALILAEHAASVTLIHRRAHFSARSEFIERVQANERISTRMFSQIRSINGSSKLESLTIVDAHGESLIESDILLIRIGVVPSSGPLAGSVEVDGSGYIVTDGECRTSVKGVYAVGDVAQPFAKTIATAAGMGATAIKSIEQFIRNSE